MLEKAIEAIEKKEGLLLENGKSLKQREKEKLETLKSAQAEMQDILDLMPERHKEWLNIYSEESGQRYPGMTGPGSLIHSEIREDLKDMGLSDVERMKVTRILKEIDKIMIQHSQQIKDGGGSGKIEIPQAPSATRAPESPKVYPRAKGPATE